MRRKLTHGELIHDVWPDKSLFGAVMLFITGLVGVAFVAFSAYVDVVFSERVPRILRDYPPLLTLLLSFAAFVCAAVSLRQRDTNWAFAGALAGVLSLGLLGVGSVLSLIAAVFLVLSRLEREDYTPETLRLTADQWPDKSLAASLLMFMAGVVALLWGGGLTIGLVSLDLGATLILGQASLLAGLVCLFAALQLYFQRGLWVGALAAVGGIATVGFYVVGPLLSLAALVLIVLAHREQEFHKPGPTPEPESGSTKPAR